MLTYPQWLRRERRREKIETALGFVAAVVLAATCVLIVRGLFTGFAP